MAREEPSLFDVLGFICRPLFERDRHKQEAILRQRIDDLETDVEALRRETKKRRWIPR